MYVLFGRNNTGSLAVEALLEEAGAKYTLKDVTKKADKSTPEWFFDINPRGEVPVLQLPDGSLMTESAAIMIYLADKLGTGLAPRIDDAVRPAYLRWMVFLAANAYNSDLRMYYPERYSVDLKHAPDIKLQAEKDLERDLAQFSSAVGEGPYILGKQFSAVDIYAAMLIGWAPDVDAVFRRHRNLKELYKRTVERPRIAVAWARHGVPTLL
jgi:glutathione S-transferase